GLTYTVGSKQYAFHKDSMGWKSGEKTLDANTMNPVLNTLASLRADDFVDTAMRIDSHPISLRINGSEDVTLNFYPSLPDSARYYVQRGKANQFFVINKFTAQQLLKPIEQPSVASHIAATSPAKEPPSSKPIPMPAPPPIVQKKETPKQAPPATTTTIAKKEPPKKETPKIVSEAVQKNQESPAANTSRTPPKKQPARVKPDERTQPTATNTASPKQEQPKRTPTGKASPGTEDEGDLTVYSVKSGETMTTIARKFNVSVEQILKWNLLKSIAVKPGQELYIYVKK
ncbi:MAG: LysM peptidoglycan-binding domain-containing protein, partial [Ignavibacteriae bacterium]|nr:LysM peptidoglycan-binding domain-containing protein [Ignavibacteriota bacterium]